MKISSLKVRNYKSLRNFESEGFKEINFVHGVNNSGKSNFLSFLHWIFQRKTIANEVQYSENGTARRRREIQEITPFWRGTVYDQPFIFSDDDRSNPIEFEVTLTLTSEEITNQEIFISNGYFKANSDVTIFIQGNAESLNQTDLEFKLKTVTLEGHKIYSEVDDVQKFFEEPKDSKLKDANSALEELLDVFNDCTIFIDSDRAFKNEKLSIQSTITSLSSSEKFKNWLYNLSIDSDNYDKYKKLLEFLDSFYIPENISSTVLKDNLKSFPFSKTNISYARFKDEIEVMLENKLGRFPLKNYGTGVQQIFYILSRIFDVDGPSKILLVEELELNLSNVYQDLIIDNIKRFISDKKLLGQAFCTSHSENLLRDDFEVFEISIDEAGESKIKKSEYDPATRKTRRELMPHVAAAGKFDRQKEDL